MALVKYNNNSLSAITAASSLPTGAMTLIKEQTASSSSTISFVHGSSDVVLDSTYPIYLFKFINIHPATDQKKFMFQGTTNGSDFNTTMTTTWFQAYHDEADSNTALTYVVGEDQAQGTSFQSLSEDTGNDNDQNYCGELWLYNPSSTTFVKHFISNFNNAYSGNYSMNHYVAGYGNTTSAVDAVQFKMSSGNIDSGTIKLYGVS